MKYIGTFLTIIAAGVCLLLLNKYYINATDERTAEEIYLDSLVEQQRVSESNDKLQANFKSNGTKLFCVKHIEKHHSIKLDEYEVVRLTPTFGAISYKVNNKSYHAQCTMESTSNKVLNFKTELN